MNEDQTLEQIRPTPETLTSQEREFITKALTEAINLQGTFGSLVPTMNLIENIVRKLSTPKADV